MNSRANASYRNRNSVVARYRDDTNIVSRLPIRTGKGDTRNIQTLSSCTVIRHGRQLLSPTGDRLRCSISEQVVPSWMDVLWHGRRVLGRRPTRAPAGALILRRAGSLDDIKAFYEPKMAGNEFPKDSIGSHVTMVCRYYHTYLNFSFRGSVRISGDLKLHLKTLLF